MDFEQRMTMIQETNAILMMLSYDLSDEELLDFHKLLKEYESKRKEAIRDIVTDHVIPYLRDKLGMKIGEGENDART
jgi:hypothetical protein